MWAKGGFARTAQPDPALTEEAEALGIPADVLARRLKSDAERDLEDGAVWPQNLAAVQAFFAVQTQFRTEPTGARGLDYAGARAGFDLAGIAVTPDLWAKVRTIEQGAKDAINGVAA